MQISTLLSQVKACKNNAGACTILDILIAEFCQTSHLTQLSMCNSESYMEGISPVIYLECNREISGYFVTTIKPQIRDFDFSIDVFTVHMKDGHGLNSRSWVELDEANEVIKVSPDQTLDDIAQLAVKVAIDQHQIILEMAGLTKDLASEIAKDSW